MLMILILIKTSLMTSFYIFIDIFNISKKRLLKKILWRNDFLGKIKGTDQRVPDTKDSASLIKGSVP